MADQTGTGAGAGDTAGGTGTPFRVFATQDEFDQFQIGIETRGRKEAERRIKTVTADERATMDAMAAELEARKQRDLEAQGNYQKAKEALEKQAADRIEKEASTRVRAEKALHAHIVEKELRALALAHGAYDPEDVIARLASRIVLDADYQVGVRGTDAEGAVQDGVTMEQAVIDLLKSKPHLAKATASGKGSGAAGGASLAGSFSGTPTQRAALEKVESAKARITANPSDNNAVADMLRAQAELKAASAT